MIDKVAVKAFKFSLDDDSENITRVSHDKYEDQSIHGHDDTLNPRKSDEKLVF